MSFAQALRSSRISWLLFVSIIVSWIAVAITLDQSVLAVQHSRQLLKFGAANGALLQAGEWWRVLVSQFLHVHAPHMLFNALAVLAVGALLESGAGRWSLAIVYFVGGCIGQIASIAFYPILVSSGASEALMALCGAALLMCRSRIAYMIVTPILMVQLALDLLASGTIKAGHGWGFAAGIILGGAAVLVFRRNFTARA
jgi:rhomboid protease GluP